MMRFFAMFPNVAKAYVHLAVNMYLEVSQVMWVASREWSAVGLVPGLSALLSHLSMTQASDPNNGQLFWSH